MASPPPEPIILSTFASLINIFYDFLIVSIHTILYSRALYPSNTFIATQKYNLKVQQNRHPGVCNWILNACLATKTQLLGSQLRSINFVIYKQDAEVIERWLFDVDEFPPILEEDALIKLDALGGVGINLVDAEEQIRATLTKLQYWGKELAPLPEGCIYTLVVELKAEAELPTGQWVRSESHKNKNGANLGNVRSIKVRSVEAGLFNFQAWIKKKTEPYSEE